MTAQKNKDDEGAPSVSLTMIEAGLEVLAVRELDGSHLTADCVEAVYLAMDKVRRSQNEPKA